MPVRARWMEAHPDGEFFFMKNVDCQQYSAQIVSKILRPVFPYELQLTGKRIGRGKHRGAQRIQQAPYPRCDRGASQEKIRKMRRDISIGCL